MYVQFADLIGGLLREPNLCPSYAKITQSIEILWIHPTFQPRDADSQKVKTSLQLPTYQHLCD